MSYSNRRISRAFKDAPSISLLDHPKIVIMSDCHRGNGTWADSFINNEPLYTAALKYYDQNGYTYIELGDGDELWENRKFSDVYQIHKEIYKIFLDLDSKKRLYIIFGNHDRIKENSGYISNVLNVSIPFYESIIIESPTTKPLYLFHGYQGDFLNDNLWKLSRFLVRYLWKHLELTGVKDPTSAAKNYTKLRKTEERFIDYSCANSCTIIAGHTHRPCITKTNCGMYINSGSCVHPNSVTAIEIENSHVTLCKWSTCANDDMSLYVCKEIIAGPTKLD